jgi:adenine-specific DNA-methyltransferase
MKALRDLIGLNNFDYPKAPEFIKDLIEINCPQNGVVLDFFAGSGTTAEAVLRSNKEFNCNRKFIICSLNENNLFYDVTKKRLDALKDKYDEDYELLKI